MHLRKQQNNMSMRKIALKHKVLPKQQPLLQKALLTATFAMLSSDLFAQRWRGEYDDITPTPWWLSMFIATAFLFYLWIRKSKRLKYLDIKNETPLKVMLGQITKCFLLDIKDNPIYTIITIATLAIIHNYAIVSMGILCLYCTFMSCCIRSCYLCKVG